MSRAAHYRRTSKAAQRHGVAKARLVSEEQSTEWMSDFIASIQDIGEAFNASSGVAQSLGFTEEERVLKLRQLSKLGVLRMSAHWEGDKFIEYRWELTSTGRW